MKKILSLILSTMLIVAMALTAGCGEKKQQENPSSAGQEVSATKLGEGKTQFNFTVVDGYTLVPHLSEYFADAVHPNDLGFYRMAEGIRPVLSKVLKK